MGSEPVSPQEKGIIRTNSSPSLNQLKPTGTTTRSNSYTIGNGVGEEVPGAQRILDLVKSETKPILNPERVISPIETDNDTKAIISPQLPTNPNLNHPGMERVSRANSYTGVASNKEIKFDYTQFLDQIRNPIAHPIVRYLENFVKEFDSSEFTVKEQCNVITEFTDFILNKMINNPVWSNLVMSSTDELNKNQGLKFNNEDELLDYLQEGIEQYLMNRLHSKTFCPTNSDDRERDHVIRQRIRYFSWIQEQHLDLPSTPHNQYFLFYAQQELLKLSNFKTPRHKLICILNCCKYIFALLKRIDRDNSTKLSTSGADAFLPFLILVVIKANPDKLVSNLQYISRFRNERGLMSEAGYYLTNLWSSLGFLEGLEPSSLSITKEEFDRNLELSLKAIEDEDRALALITPMSTSEPTKPGPLVSSSTSVIKQPSQQPQQSQFSLRIKKPLDLMGKFLSEVTSPSPTPSPTNHSSSATSSAPKPMGFRQKELKKKKSFLVALFGSSSSEEDDDRDLYKHNEEDEDDQFSETEQEQFDNRKPPPRRSSLTVNIDEKLLGIYNPPATSANLTQPLSPALPLSPPVPLPRHEGIGMLRDMFPNYEPQVLSAILEAKMGDLTSSIESLLDMSDPNAPDTPRPPQPTQDSGSGANEGELIQL